MRKRKLGNQGLEVSVEGLGCMGLSEFRHPPPDLKDAVRTIHRALELGISLLDTADMYGPFKNERLIGRAIADRRDQAIVSTKFGFVRGPNGESLGIRGDAEYVRQACDASLERLGVDHIDLYYQHRVDRTVDIEETIGAMKGLVEAGKVRYIGLSEASPETVRRAHAVHPISALQVEYSLWGREAERTILEAVRDLGIGYVAYSPLGVGLLSGRFQSNDDLEDDDYRKQNHPRFQKTSLEQTEPLINAVAALAAERGVSASQLALAWVMAQGDDIVPIPGTTKIENLETNAAAAELKLSGEDLRRLEAVAPWGVTAGERYADMSTIDL